MEIPVNVPIIIDIGEAYVKIGFAGDQIPRIVFPCMTGTEKYRSIMVDIGEARDKMIYVGEDCMKMRGVLKITYPISRGNITQWESFYEILNHIFYNLLRINPSEYEVLYSEPINIPKETKEYIARVLFETHRVKKLMMIPSPLLSLFSVGLTTGLVIECGEGLTNIVPIIDGKIFYPAVQILTLAGSDVSLNLKSLLLRQGINLEFSAQKVILREIIEKFCYIALDPSSISEKVKIEKQSYVLPDGETIKIYNESMYLSPEILFQPSILGYNIQSIPEAVINCLGNINSEYWALLLKNIVVSGGNSSYNGFIERLKAELITILPNLGPIPAIPETPQIQEEKSLISQEGTSILQDTCEKCGNLVDLSSGIKICPYCGNTMKTPMIDIPLKTGIEKKSQKIKRKCPHCKKNLPPGSEHLFCPFCGQKIQDLVLQDIKEGQEEHIEEYTEPIVAIPTYYEDVSELFNFFIPKNKQFAIFLGGSILGSLPSFKKLFINSNQFATNPNLLYHDISEIFKIE